MARQANLSYKAGTSVIFKKRNNTSTLVFVLTTGLFGYFLHIELLTMLEKIRHTPIDIETTIRSQQQANLIISSYFKGGGNVLGDVLKSRENTFFSFEPLFVVSTWSYFKNLTAKCVNLFPECYDAAGGSEKALDKVRAVFTCNIPDLLGEYYHPRWNEGGSAWVQYKTCLEGVQSTEVCRQRLASNCTASSSRITKIERLSVQLLSKHIMENENITLVHIFRDPRAILYANVQGKYFTHLSSMDGIKAYAKNLCSRMEEDFDAGLKLMANHGKQFKFLLYEDFVSNMEGVLRLIMRFVGIPFKVKDRDTILDAEKSRAATYAIQKAKRQYNVDEKYLTVEGDELKIVLNVNQRIQLGGHGTLPILRSQHYLKTINLEEYAHPFHWRKDIDFEMVKVIDSVCERVYKKIGYNVYHTEAMLRSMDDWPSFGAKGIYPM